MLWQVITEDTTSDRFINCNQKLTELLPLLNFPGDVHRKPQRNTTDLDKSSGFCTLRYSNPLLLIQKPMGSICLQQMSESISAVQTRHKLKIVVLGDQSTGKSSIIDRYINNRFDTCQQPTVGIDFLGKNVTHNNQPFRLQLWDTAGQERFRSLIPNYIKDAACAIFVFDLASQQTITGLSRWMELFEDHRTRKSVTVLCGNKKDLSKGFDRTKLQSLLEKYQMSFIEVSALTGQGINKLFETVLDELAAKTTLTKDNINSECIDGPTSKPLLIPSELPPALFQSRKNLYQYPSTTAKSRCC